MKFVAAIKSLVMRIKRADEWEDKSNHQLIAWRILEFGEVDGDYALIWAVKNGYLTLVKHLVDHYGVDIHANREHALRAALEKDHQDVVEYLLRQGANWKIARPYL